MSSYNKIIVVGNVTRDPETRFLAGGDGVTKFSVAVSRKTKQGEDTMFLDVTAWNKLGEVCNQYLKKGMPVLVEGRLSIRHYDDKDGNKRTAVEVVASEMQMLGSKPGGSNGGGYQSRGNPAPATSTAANDIDDDEVPF